MRKRNSLQNKESGTGSSVPLMNSGATDLLNLLKLSLCILLGLNMACLKVNEIMYADVFCELNTGIGVFKYLACYTVLHQ